jgi:hypothetical protein
MHLFIVSSNSESHVWHGQRHQLFVVIIAQFAVRIVHQRLYVTSTIFLLADSLRCTSTEGGM